MIEETLLAILAELKRINSPQIPLNFAGVTDKTTVDVSKPPFAAVTETSKVETAIFPETKTEAPTREKVGADLIALATEKGREAAIATLNQFGGLKLADVKVEDYTKLTAAIAKARL